MHDVVGAKRGERLPAGMEVAALAQRDRLLGERLTAFAFASVVWIRPCSIRAPVRFE